MSWKDDTWGVNERARPLLSYEDMKAALPDIKKLLDGKYIRATISTLGGTERPTLMITVSLEDKKDWANDILQNSRYRKISIDHDGTVDNFTSSHNLKKIRKKRVKSIRDAISYINKNIHSVK